MVGQLQREREAYLAALSDEDRLALVQGRGMPSRRRPMRHLIRGVSEQAAGLFTLLERSGGERLVRSLVANSVSGAYVSPATAELERLGLAERVGVGESSRVRLLPAAEGVVLMSSWSMSD